jgi:hypothetical protein
MKASVRWWAAGRVVAVVLGVMAALACAPAGAGAGPILFAANPPVPRAVQEFAWDVIERRCAYQSYERWQRSFWAGVVRVARVEGDTVYRIEVLSDLSWKKTEPTAVISMTIVDEESGLRLAALRSSFIPCRR